MMPLQSKKTERWEKTDGQSGAVKRQCKKGTQKITRNRDRRKKDNFLEAFYQHPSEHTAGLTVSVMKRALSVRPITSDWCSWVADW